MAASNTASGYGTAVMSLRSTAPRTPPTRMRRSVSRRPSRRNVRGVDLEPLLRQVDRVPPDAAAQVQHPLPGA